MPHHNLANFKPCLEYTTEGKTVGGEPLPNTSEGPHFRPQPQPLHFVVGRTSSAMIENGKLDRIEERLRVIEGSGDYAFANMAELCLVLDVIIPLKFKVTEFDKCKGTTWPKNHLKLYCRKMGAYEKDEKLLMHFFQESLTGATVTWYTNLEPSQIHSWKDLMISFIRQYQYNSDMALDRMQLQSIQEGAQIFQGIRPKVEGSGSPSGAPYDEERDDHIDSRHITSVLL